MALCVLALAGCAAPSRTVTINEPFDGAQAGVLLAGGTNTITGSALMRQVGGGVVTCAGNEVFLIPATRYAKNRLQAIYGSGKTLGILHERLTFNPDPPEYKASMKTTRCNAQGFFRFDTVADGEFFVQTSIVWKAGTYSPQGGSLIDQITVRGGQVADITMAP